MQFLLSVVLALLVGIGAVHAQTDDAWVLQARDAQAKGDRAVLALLRERAIAAAHPLAPWIDYWDIGLQLAARQQADLDAFYARWPGSYVEDRLRNDWLLELGKRRDWANFRREFPRFRMNDDREVSCYALLTRHLDGEDVAAPSLKAWLAQRDLDDGCQLLASTLEGAGRIGHAQVWLKARLATEANRASLAKATAALVSPEAERAVGELFDNPARYLARHPGGSFAGTQAELALLAMLRLAATDPEVAATQINSWQGRLPRSLAAWAWAGTARQAAWRQLPQAVEWYQRAWRTLPKASDASLWSLDTLAWAARTALRATMPEAERWALFNRALDAMPADERDDPAWVYWRARGELARAPRGEPGDEARAAAMARLTDLAGSMDFYGLLAADTLGLPVALPPLPAPPSDEERAAVRQRPGLQRALQLFALGLRSEAVREWNFTLRDLKTDRELLAAAQWACEREVWDRCINTSERTRHSIDMAQRYPTPLREAVLATARDTGIDPALAYGLIRQESRFIMDARSGAGASGLMQLMPGTARWTARKLGIDYRSSMITDRDVNLRLGMGYLKLVLDDFEGSHALAAAAYNAGPSRSRRWREGPAVETAAWAENVPFNETRDYVKKVIANTVWYAALLGGQAPTVRNRLDPVIGPRRPDAPPADKALP